MLHGQGLPIKEIARRAGASRNTVRRWVRVGRFVPYCRAPGPSRLDHHLPFVEARWDQGQHNAAVLHRELRVAGFAGGYDIVRRWAARRRRTSAKPLPARIPSTRRITRWLTSDPVALSGDPAGRCDLDPHLHLEIRRAGMRETVNPVPLVNVDWRRATAGIRRNGTTFERDPDNPDRWMAIADQPDVVFGGALLNRYARGWP